MTAHNKSDFVSSVDTHFLLNNVKSGLVKVLAKNNNYSAIQEVNLLIKQTIVLPKG
ncbi:hypothetical protein [Rivularia sp. UHCC 0363]|uniref:hypothetical protein n=1 Tax=Rivularia sp. UHCC 0363 TaxID=3110244 RepID=UPI002B1E98EC|nr:hypothetical protein [Rivularia sp. UHCC 0363]MEA5594983.1 hypothetical protein [Rivularia sp. UHCC 0363]